MILFFPWKEMEALKTLVFFSNFVFTSSKFWGEQIMTTISITPLEMKAFAKKKQQFRKFQTV